MNETTTIQTIRTVSKHSSIITLRTRSKSSTNSLKTNAIPI